MEDWTLRAHLIMSYDNRQQLAVLNYVEHERWHSTFHDTVNTLVQVSNEIYFYLVGLNSNNSVLWQWCPNRKKI